ncbi:hypothetical protein JQ615_28010 [Bradyrhizobium jicamae]|uniref:Uncharacterized protein n=1 Tax=Bradyrhizobium jicamae TaxID=280332 RepID=A0ABS5FR71_9BRAD|nr:hypothetical protein [Bradyrhizobium jicamae]MBR0799241.1 hypothetical protein [Bradyrhizobium jicamae]
MFGSFPRALRAAHLVACVTLLVSPASADPANAQGGRQTPPPALVPTFESLPHTALPTARFEGWCGQNGRYILDENGQLNAYEAGTKVAAVAVSPGHAWQCSRDGRQLINISIPHVFMVDIASGDSQWIASYDEKTFGNVAFSPDFKSVASSTPLELKPQAPQLKVILVRDKSTASKTERPDWIKWSEDGSEIAVVYPTSVDILDRDGVTIASMTKPGNGWVKDGWFEKDQRALTLFMEQEQPPGFILKCSVAGKRCLARTRIESVSFGGRGTVGTVIPLGRPPVREDDSILISKEYAAEIRSANSRLLVRQVFSTRTGLRPFHIAVSPSGKWSILTWDDENQPGCVYGQGDAALYKCGQGMLVDLTKVIK